MEKGNPHSPFAYFKGIPLVADSDLIDPNQVNKLSSRECLACGYEWEQPAQSGACPKCHSLNTLTHQHRSNELPRI